MSKSISVYLLRHGEREDEVGEGLYQRRSTKECIDPGLTPQGYVQAKAAFTKLLSTLTGKRVAIFTSPLRRTIGTALMSAAVPFDTKVNWILPTTEGPSASDGIPVVVMNGLCDCAAAVQYLGGAYRSVSLGYIDNAAMDSNDSSFASPCVCSLREIVSCAQGSTECFSNEYSSKIQFWKETDSSSSCLLPLAPPIVMSEAMTWSTFANNSENRQTPVASKPSDDNFLSTLNRAVKMSVNANCDACILVTHREGIRFLIRQLCQHREVGRDHVSTPYCCIAKFIVVASSSGFHWEFERISAYEHIR